MDSWAIQIQETLELKTEELDENLRAKRIHQPGHQSCIEEKGPMLQN
ncbi:2134_t:CDS:2 [Ambispora leptoticha]|uniref:2134_t:CDS:1 n=1 Tax=Ambispora leptoticha TaxID=144679 RepID=A0A9N9ESN8_9GLOM|nr:2134_t:CDS:2 [Ambispora leptoticha]